MIEVLVHSIEAIYSNVGAGGQVFRYHKQNPSWNADGLKRNTVSDCKATYAKVYGISRHRLWLKAGPIFPEDTNTLSGVQKMVTKSYTSKANLVVFEAIFGLNPENVTKTTCQ